MTGHKGVSSIFLFVFSNDDAGSGDVGMFYELLNFLRRHNVRGNFFVVPTPGGKPMTDEWRQALGLAIDDGHMLEMHGLTHSSPAGCEFGITPPFVLDVMKDGRKTVQERRAEIEKELTVVKIGERLKKGLDAFKRSLNVIPKGFRSPCLAVHENMFLALKGNGFVFDSSIAINTGGWRYISKHQGLKYLNREYVDLDGWAKGIPAKPYMHGCGLVEVPILSEYTWYLRERDVERQLDVALDDLDRVRKAKGVFVALSHYYAMTGEYSAGLKVYEKLFNLAKQKGAEFVTMEEAVKQVPP